MQKESNSEKTPLLPPNTNITIYFDSDESILLPQEKNKLEGSSTDKKYVVHGYCDSDGTEAYNLTLAEQRCQVVILELTRLGISPSQIDMAVHGESSPATSNKTASGKAKNRRVEIEID